MNSQDLIAAHTPRLNITIGDTNLKMETPIICTALCKSRQLLRISQISGTDFSPRIMPMLGARLENLPQELLESLLWLLFSSLFTEDLNLIFI